MSFRGFLFSLVLLTGLVLLTFFGLQLLHVATGSLLDWMAAVVLLWWFAAVLILPWDAHFAALDVVEQARDSESLGIAVPADTVAYAQRIARRFRQLAVGLHLATAGALLVLAYFHLVPFGYLAAGVALALTVVRPAQRAYEHLATRLRNMGQQIRYPREDVAELRHRVAALEATLENVERSLDVDREGSWAATQNLTLAALRQALDRYDSRLEELARQTVTEIARLSEDARFLNQVRELIRFWKQA